MFSIIKNAQKIGEKESVASRYIVFLYEFPVGYGVEVRRNIN